MAPGATSQPFTDFRATIAGLPPSEQSKVVGRSNLTLIERGVVSWNDVVTRTRVRDFREVVSRKRLTVVEMVRGGVAERQARDAYEAVHTPAHELAAKARQDLVDRVLAKGIERDALRKALAERLAARVGIEAGPSGPGTIGIRPTTPRAPAGGGAPRRISAAPEGERLYSPQREYLASLGVKETAIEAVAPARPASSEPILPGRPIAERIAAYADGRERVKRLAAIGSELDRLEADLATMGGRVDAAMARTKTGGPELEAARAAYRDAYAEAEAARVALRQQARDILATGERFHLGADAAKSLSDDQRSVMGEGLRWVQRNVVPPAGSATGHAADAPMLIPMKSLRGRQDQRSYATDAEIRLDRTADTSTVVHEIGHYLDFHAAGMDAAAREFLAHRVGDEPFRKLKDVLGGNYKDHELGRKDRFDETFGNDGWYAGKAYSDGMTEITSMGMEMMYRDPIGFARKDPEYATFVLGLMHGPLR